MDRQDFFRKPAEPFNPLLPTKKEGDDGPKAPDVTRPGGKNLLDRMKRVDPNTAKRYKQRSGQ